jgi:hypothetical protein
MPKVSTSLSMVSILVVLLSQSFARNPASLGRLSGVDAVFAFTLMFCAIGLLTSWLSRPITQKPDDDESGRHQK